MLTREKITTGLVLSSSFIGGKLFEGLTCSAFTAVIVFPIKPDIFKFPAASVDKPVIFPILIIILIGIR